MDLFTTLTILLLLASACALPEEMRPRHLGTKGNKGGKGGNGGKQKKLDTTCAVYQVYENVVRTNIPGGKAGDVPWRESCDEFEPMDYLLCPSDKVIQAICDHKNPHLNPAVKFNYCTPLFDSLEDEEEKAKCIFNCVNYVSVDRGGCCDFECAVEE